MNRGLVNRYSVSTDSDPLTWMIRVFVGACLILSGAAIGAGISHSHGIDTGRHQMAGEIRSALKEQIQDGHNFTLAGIDGVVFMPRIDGRVAYTYAGAGDDTPAREGR